MFLNVPISATGKQLIATVAKYFQVLLEDFPLDSQTITIEAVDDLYALYEPDTIFLIQDGMLHISRDEQTLCSFDEGDIVGITQAFGYAYPALHTDEYVELIPINRDQFIQHIFSDKRRALYWTHFLVCYNAILTELLAAALQERARPTVGLQNLQVGDVIIQQGDSADMVYSLIEGEAEAYADGVMVGKILPEEVFGAMAIFTGETRSATVIASQPSTIIAVPKQDFVRLIEAQPKAAAALIENLARHITNLNQKLVEQHEQD